MKLKIDFEVSSSKKKITYNSKCIFLGSCFSDDISRKKEEVGFDVLSNPFGTLFHPLAILNLFEEIDIEETCFQRDDIWFSWLTSGTIFDMSKDALIGKINFLFTDFYVYLKEADFLFLTFGTSIGYRLESNNLLVANCHKMNSSLFVKELTLSDQMSLQWEKCIQKIQKINPNIEVVFTVSPVRHIKEGIVLNNISKSQLFSLIHNLNGNYFPSFEIVNDELRDYRFFKDDLVHPNQSAIDYVWEKFRATYMDNQTNLLIDEVFKVKQMLHHKTLYPNSIESKKFQEKINFKKSEILKKLPNMKW